MPDASIDFVLPCVDLGAMTAFFVEQLGLRVDTVSPADDPDEVVLVGHGARIRLRRAPVAHPARLVMRTDGSAAGTELVAPDGTVVELASSSVDVVVPDGRPSLSIVRATGDFGTGRAGMGYRDLLPDRWGGRFIASHIRLAEDGDVADWVHFHRIRFQMIYVAAGWVDVVYEDQGPPFRMHAGDCVLQPPGIRHRVLRNGEATDVIEIGCPAQHDTVADHELTLPTAEVRPERDFGGQRFVRHVAADAATLDGLVDGWRSRDTGIGAATDGLAGARVVSAPAGEPTSAGFGHAGEFAMAVVIAGSADFTTGGRTDRFGPWDAIALPAGTTWSWAEWTDDFELLEVTLPSGAIQRVGG